LPGRLAIFKDKDFINDSINLIQNNYIGKITHNFNIPPSLPIPALLNNGNYLYTHFGYLPPWAKTKNDFHINARSESIFEKQTFRDAFKFRRCIIPINGFYEWKKEDITKTPYFVRDNEKSYLAVAGIWNEYYSHELQQNIVSVALITCDANDKLSPIHHRMPVILEKEDFSTWLLSDDIQQINQLLQIYPSQKLKIYEVTQKVNKVGFNSLEAVQEVSKDSLF
jgi:putative SOS response-associated peptidase YedK